MQDLILYSVMTCVPHLAMGQLLSIFKPRAMDMFKRSGARRTGINIRTELTWTGVAYLTSPTSSTSPSSAFCQLNTISSPHWTISRPMGVLRFLNSCFSICTIIRLK
uniref:Uncharacterized protein n=1 Tax=Cacopsylla melanoneura TaxID=428564 RepID=A0A8D8RY22_9HEMI